MELLHDWNVIILCVCFFTDHEIQDGHQHWIQFLHRILTILTWNPWTICLSFIRLVDQVNKILITYRPLPMARSFTLKMTRLPPQICDHFTNTVSCQLETYSIISVYQYLMVTFHLRSLYYMLMERGVFNRRRLVVFSK